MATVYGTPEHISAPSFNSDRDIEAKAREKYIEEVRGYCKSHSNGCPHTGKVIRFQIADGFAQYMILDYKTLVHLELDDCWQISKAHSRGLQKADIIRAAEAAEAREAIPNLLEQLRKNK
jgi:hypothetical protein